MERILEIALLNAATVTLLAVTVALVGRFLRRPAVLHALWLLVLIKLFTPPVLEVAALPAPTRAPEARATATVSALPDPAIVEAVPAPLPAPVRPSHIVLIGWLSGSVLLAGLALLRLRRFETSIRHASTAPPDLQRRAARIARRLGLSRRPRVGLVEGRVPPMLWSRFGPCRILVPEALLPRLQDDELDALVAHELAHVKRRDHWVRHFEMASTALFWWHPLVWWIRRRLRLEEERSCDALVLRTFPERSRAYAEGLLKTVEFLSGKETEIPALATGAGETRQLGERLKMIVERRIPTTTTRTQRWSIAMLGAAALLIFPTWAEPDRAADAAEDPHRSELLELQRQSMDLERQMHDLDLQRMDVEREMREKRLQAELEALQTRLDEFEARGEPEHAAMVRAVMDKARQQHELSERQMALEFELQQQIRPVERELRETALEVERSRLAGDSARTAELQDRLAETEHRLRDVTESGELRRRALQREPIGARAAQLEHEAQELAAGGHEAEARRVEERMAELEARSREADRAHDAARDTAERAERELVRAREAELRRLRTTFEAQELAEQMATREARAAERELRERELADRSAEVGSARAEDEIRRLDELKRDLERKLDEIERRGADDDAGSLDRLREELRRIQLELDRLQTY